MRFRFCGLFAALAVLAAPALAQTPPAGAADGGVSTPAPSASSDPVQGVANLVSPLIAPAQQLDKDNAKLQSDLKAKADPSVILADQQAIAADNAALAAAAPNLNCVVFHNGQYEYCPSLGFGAMAILSFGSTSTVVGTAGGCLVFNNGLAKVGSATPNKYNIALWACEGVAAIGSNQAAVFSAILGPNVELTPTFSLGVGASTTCREQPLPGLKQLCIEGIGMSPTIAKVFGG